MSPTIAPDSIDLSRPFTAREPSLRQDCPDPDDIYEAVSGRLRAARREAVLDHVSVCAECAVAWQLAAELQSATAEPVGLPVRPGRPMRTAPLAAAATLVMAVALTMLVVTGPRETTPPGYRGAGTTAAPESLLEVSSLPREDFRLRWSAGPAGATYTLRVTDATLAPVYVREDIAATEHVVPAAALEDLRGGDQVLWQVEVRLPDGSRHASPTYAVTVRTR